MPIVTVVHIVFDNINDPEGFAKRHVGREMGKGKTQSDIVGHRWLHRHDPVPNAITSTSFRAPPFTPVEIYYDPAGVAGATEQDVVDALTKACTEIGERASDSRIDVGGSLSALRTFAREIVPEFAY